jgi:hypothetical protein
MAIKQSFPLLLAKAKIDTATKQYSAARGPLRVGGNGRRVC